MTLIHSLAQELALSQAREKYDINSFSGTRVGSEARENYDINSFSGTRVQARGKYDINSFFGMSQLCCSHEKNMTLIHMQF